MILLVDTDILIDFALDRRPHAAAAAELLDALERRQATGFIAWHSVANLHYLVVSKQGASATKAFLLDPLRFAGFADVAREREVRGQPSDGRFRRRTTGCRRHRVRSEHHRYTKCWRLYSSSSETDNANGSAQGTR